MAYQNQWQHSKMDWDWGDISVNAPKPPPAGLYDLKLMEVTVTETKGEGGKAKVPMIKVRAEIIKADDAANEGAIGRTVFDNWVFSAGGAFKVKNAATVMGKDLPTSLELDELDGFAKSCEGEVLPAMLDQRTYEGKTNANVRYYGNEAPNDENGNGSREEAHPARAKGGKSRGARR